MDLKKQEGGDGVHKKSEEKREKNQRDGKRHCKRKANRQRGNMGKAEIGTPPKQDNTERKETRREQNEISQTDREGDGRQP